MPVCMVFPWRQSSQLCGVSVFATSPDGSPAFLAGFMFCVRWSEAQRLQAVAMTCYLAPGQKPGPRLVELPKVSWWICYMMIIDDPFKIIYAV